MTDAPARLPPAGWYPDPHNPETTQRWWNGSEWADAYAPIDTPVVDPQDPPRSLSRLQAVAVAGVIVVGFLEAFNIYADAVYLGVIDDLLAEERVSASRIDDAEQVVDIAAIAVAGGYLLIGRFRSCPGSTAAISTWGGSGCATCGTRPAGRSAPGSSRSSTSFAPSRSPTTSSGPRMAARCTPRDASTTSR